MAGFPSCLGTAVTLSRSPSSARAAAQVQARHLPCDLQVPFPSPGFSPPPTKRQSESGSAAGGRARILWTLEDARPRARPCRADSGAGAGATPPPGQHPFPGAGLGAPPLRAPPAAATDERAGSRWRPAGLQRPARWLGVRGPRRSRAARGAGRGRRRQVAPGAGGEAGGTPAQKAEGEEQRRGGAPGRPSRAPARAASRPAPGEPEGACPLPSRARTLARRAAAGLRG